MGQRTKMKSQNCKKCQKQIKTILCKTHNPEALKENDGRDCVKVKIYIHNLYITQAIISKKDNRLREKLITFIANNYTARFKKSSHKLIRERQTAHYKNGQRVQINNSQNKYKWAVMSEVVHYFTSKQKNAN